MHSTTNDSKELLALNKPKGYVVTRSDELGRKTVYDLLPDWVFNDGWMPIGRLDLESKGLLLFTTNGQIGNALTKPGNCIKVYEIWVRGHVTDEHIAEAMMLGMKEGEIALVSNEYGSLQLPLRFATLAPKHLFAPFGYASAPINTLVPVCNDPFSQQSALKSAQVSLRALTP